MLYGLVRKLDANKSNNITVEINIPIQRINRNIAGLFATDEEGSIFLLHRGKIGGGRKGVGKNAFISSCNQSFTDVRSDKNRVDNALLIGNISEEDFITKLSLFIENVYKFKESIKSKEN